MADSSDFYPNEDFNFEMTDVVLEQQIEAPESSKTSHESVITRKPHAIQRTLPFSTISSEIKEKGELSETNIKYKRKKPSFTQEYFEKKANDKDEKIRVCNILDKNGIKCGQEYKCGRSGRSTGNLIVHLRDKHNIVPDDDAYISKKLRNSKITDFARSHKPHPKHIQKRLTNEAYKEKMAEFDPSFIIPGEKKIRTMIVKSYKFNRENLQNLLTNTAENVSLTIDLWSSKAKHGYLGVTATWITSNFEIKDTMLENKYVSSPHTSEIIANELHQCIETWNLKNHVTSITTDNGSNMVAIFPFLNQKNGCENIQRLPCTVHTLQLAIGKGLASVEILVARARRLINFFQYQKQVERLEQVQRKLGYKDILRCIQDVSTRWNSSYYAWDRLFFLKDAIIQLQTDLSTSTDREIKKDGNRLKKLLLNDDEWELLDQLVDLLMPFEEATREFSGNSYITLSRVIPTIKEMIFDLATEVLLNSDDFSNEDTVFESEAVETQQTDFDDDEIISNITKKKISIKNPLNTVGVLEKVKQNIYSALIFYWNIPNDLGLMAALLDPLEIPGSEPLNNPASYDAEPLRSHKEYHQRRQMKNKKGDKSYSSTPIVDEITNYLTLPLALTNLDTNLVAKILFLKRNIKTMHVFASEWDEDETSHVEID
ncbi:zinc finger BED domain-containing protein 1-like [Rhizophagus irregularis DAOM 181602=DAOM 197198]|nr:zinc finger BED domain-containing protein 1-like [Rhizophagus irregularis DAOM 181602=DAOM 197198]